MEQSPDVASLDHAADLDLLRRRAPILRFDERELFFPTEVDGYVESASLHIGSTEIRAEGEVTLAELDHRHGSSSHLRFVSDTDRRNVVKDDLRRLARNLLAPRLGRVGFFGRIIDALFMLTNLIRPMTPRRTTIASALKAERLGLQNDRVVYGRAVISGEWLVLHYAYFYVMNDWRTGYRGLNDHEADWEQAWVFCDPADQRPVWVAASSHEYAGPDLRRHWDDPELLTHDGHPVLFPGAGSHALYFRPGDYVTRIDVAGLRWLLRAQAWVRRALRIRDEATERGLGPALGAPFVDTATGDGEEVRSWSVRRLSEDESWVSGYRGLWGLDTGDPAGGERGPSGPKFNRRGEVRTSWADPVGFAGLHGTPPPSATDRRVNIDKLTRALAELDVSIRRRGNLLPLAAQTGNPEEMVEESDRLTELLRQQAELFDLRRRLVAGADPVVDEPRAHLRQPAVPLPPPKESGWILAGWAALSVPLLLVAAAAVVVSDRLEFVGLALAGAAGAVLAEQLVRRHFQAFFRLLVVYTLVVLFFLFVLGGALTVSRYAIGAALAIGGSVLFVANLGELRAVQHYRSQTAEQQPEPTAAGHPGDHGHGGESLGSATSLAVVDGDDRSGDDL